MTAKEILKEITASSDKLNEIKENPEQYLSQRLTDLDPEKNKGIFTIVVVFIGIALLLSIAGVMIQAHENETVQNFYVMIASGAIGALAGLVGHRAATSTSDK